MPRRSRRDGLPKVTREFPRGRWLPSGMPSSPSRTKYSLAHRVSGLLLVFLSMALARGFGNCWILQGQTKGSPERGGLSVLLDIWIGTRRPSFCRKKREGRYQDYLQHGQRAPGVRLGSQGLQSAMEKSVSLTRGLPLLASVVGAFVGGLSMLPWIFPNHLDWPAYLSYPVNAVGLLSIPGMFLSLVATSLLQRGVAH